MTIGTASDDQAVRIFELVRVAVRSPDHNVQEFALTDNLAADAEILPSGTNAALRRSVKPQELLGCEIDEFRARLSAAS